MLLHGEPTSCADVSNVVDALRTRTSLLPAFHRPDYVSTELFCVDRALCRLRSQGLARGPVFCDWGSGLGGVCIMAALNGFDSYGVEIDSELVSAARALTADLDLSVTFVEGSFLQPGDDLLVTDPRVRTRLVFDTRAWRQLDLRPIDCDVVFSYPWPGDEGFIERVFAARASHGALLLTFHDFDRILAQRKIADRRTLETIGWL